MNARYHQIVESLRNAFPQPSSGLSGGGSLADAILGALDRLDRLQLHVPRRSAPQSLDYDAARRSRLTDEGCALAAVIAQLVDTQQELNAWSLPRTQANVDPQPTIASVVGALLPALTNPNLCSDESGRGCSVAEVRASAMAAELVGYDPARSAGVFTFGGTGGLLYGLKIGLEKAVPGAAKRGLREDVVVFASLQGHSSIHTAAAWLGIGAEHVVAVPCSSDDSMQLDALERSLREAFAAGRRVAAIVATMGTTEAFGIDDLAAIHALRARLVKEFELDYTPHLHADAVIGWAWSVFNGYDFGTNPLGFRTRTVRSLSAAHSRIQHLDLADSIGIDFHKTGYAPYISSLVLVRDAADFRRIARPREHIPYLYQSGEHHPGLFTLETSRSAVGPLAALSSMLLLGRQGYRALVGHAVEMAETLRALIETSPHLAVVNPENVGPATLFRAYPDEVDAASALKRELNDPNYREQLFAHNEYNRRVHARLQSRTLALTHCCRRTDHGDPVVALKSYVLSPFATERDMQTVLQSVLDARDELRS